MKAVEETKKIAEDMEMFLPRTSQHGQLAPGKLR